MKIKCFITIVFTAAVFFSVLFTACGNADPGVSDVTEKFPLEIPTGNKVLAITNMSSVNANVRFNFGLQTAKSILGSEKSSAVARSLYGFSPSGGIIRKDLNAASEFNANPPSFSPDTSPRLRAGPDDWPTAAGSKKDIYVQDISGTFVPINATLVKRGTHCNIWMETPDTTQADSLAAVFDQIYPLATNLLGYEFGGGAGGNGGRDGDTNIQIFVYNIAGNPAAGMVGYFWSKDYYTQAQLDNSGNKNLKTNLAEIFYIDAVFLTNNPDIVYSTLIHEYQHMINFNEKTIKQNRTSQTWYSEMLSMLAEDVIGPLVGINPGDPSKAHPIDDRIPLFLDAYSAAGIDQWPRENEDDIFTILASYSIVYAFGAYLVRNYGGPQLIKDMMSNNSVNQNSITDALRLTNSDSSLDFEKALERYAEALVHSITIGGITGKMSFDRAASSTINSTTYTAKAFNIWDITRATNTGKGPGYSLLDTGLNNIYGYEAPGHSIQMCKIPNAWSGSYFVNLTRPSNVKISLNVLAY